jgi:hypothetical protein
VTVDKILAERKTQHGDFSVHSRITQQLKAVIKSDRGKLGDLHNEAVDMILHKIGRICAGDPNLHDHWDDIAGYATLVSQRIPGK